MEQEIGGSEWTWRQEKVVGDVFTPRTGHTIVEFSQCFYLFGGTDKDRRQKDLFKFDTRTNEKVMWCPPDSKAATIVCTLPCKSQ